MANKIHKIAVTLELTDDQMVGIGFAETGLMVIAKHAEVRSYAKQAAMGRINEVTSITNTYRNRAAQEIKVKLGSQDE